MQQRSVSIFGVIAIAIFGALVGCSLNDDGFLGLGKNHDRLDSSVDKPPADTASIDSQLLRYRGQTRFLNVDPYSWQARPGPMPVDDENRTSRAAAGRAIQEADLFKIGKAGSKLLFLLNNFRGLQIVSYADDADNPKLVGRVAPTGNWSEQMYYQPEKDRLIVMERLWNDVSSESTLDEGLSGSLKSRLLVYDVKIPSNPRISQELLFEGEIADSRIVGNVLYVATRFEKDRNAADPAQRNGGRVMSFTLAGETISKAASLDLTLPVSLRENMGIIEVAEGLQTKYYLTAILSESGWGWWDRKSGVELIDISSDTGEIKPVMVVSAKGNIRERSQVIVKNNTLVVVSNYQLNFESRQRVAVESYILPKADTRALTAEEGDFRRLALERKFNAAPESEREALFERLIVDAEIGLKGQFIMRAGTLHKDLADVSVNVGDTTGQHAQLQDVRVEGNLLYVFWVPQNQIDPLDLFDISQTQKSIPYLGRLNFDGWIERAIPLTHEGHTYVLGLGWIVPAVGNETNRRYPQAALFEISHQAQGSTSSPATPLATPPTAKLKAQLTLSGANSWVDFNAADKFVDIRRSPDNPGLATILFQISSWDPQRFTSGGKLVGLDLNAANSGQGVVLTEGALLGADEGWVRRVFANPEISRINTFSDTSLATFNVAGGLGAAREILAATHILELARNIRAYTTLGVMGVSQPQAGIQFVERNTRNQTGREHALLEIRRVDAKNADAEASTISEKLTINGRYLDHLNSANGSEVTVLTADDSEQSTPEGHLRLETTYHVSRLTLSQGRLTLIGQAAFTPAENLASGAPREARLSDSWLRPYRPYQFVEPKLIQLKGGPIVALIDTTLVQVAAGNPMRFEAMSLTDCSLQEWRNTKLFAVNGQAFFTYGENFEHPNRKNLQLARHFLVPVSFEGQAPGKATCQKPFNIPGTLKGIGEQGRLVVADDRVVGFKEHRVQNSLPPSMTPGTPDSTISHEAVTEKSLAILQQMPGQSFVSLTDITQAPFDSQEGTLLPGIGDHLRLFFVGTTHDFSERIRTVDNASVVLLSSDANGLWQQQRGMFSGLNLDGNPRVLNLTAVSRPQTDTFVALLAGERRIQAIEFSAANLKDEVRLLRLKQPSGLWSKARSSIVLPSGFYGSTENAVHFNSSSETYEIAQNLFGITQLQLQRASIVAQ